DIEQSRDIIKILQQQYIDNGIGRWAVLLKESNQFIGWAGLKLIRNVNDRLEFYELGYRLITKYWGKGYAFEASKAILDYGFKEMNIEVICAQTSSENKKSQHLLLKLEFTYMNTFEYDGGYDQWYEIRNPQLAKGD
ncbi:MAG TPA: GNAT family N-acetyltransferase, partial [Flavobacterium sp.]